MAEFSDVKVSADGMHLIELSATMKKPLIFTKVEIGGGISDGTDKTALISKKMEATVTRVAEVQNADEKEARVVAYFAYSNDGLTEGFSATEIGIYAKVSSESYTDNGWGGYTGDETFYGYAYANENKKGEWIPDKTHKMDVQEIAIYASVGNADSVGVSIESGSTVYAREEDFEEHLNDVDAHQDFKGCTDTTNGVRGFVPAPAKGDTLKFLSAQGNWQRAGHSVLELVNILYPVGIVVEFENTTDPNTQWPGTTWVMTQAGQVGVGAGEYWENGTKYTYTLGDTGGEVKHKLSADELAAHTHRAICSTDGNHNHGYSRTNPANPDHAATGSNAGHWENMDTDTAGNHSHTITISPTGGNGSHENRQPYKVVNKWKRTA